MPRAMPWEGGFTGALGRDGVVGVMPPLAALLPLAAERPPVAATERRVERPVLVGELLKVVVAMERLGELVDRLELAVAAWEARLLWRRSTVFATALAGSALAGSALAGDGLARMVVTAGSGLAGSWITGATVDKALLAAAGVAAPALTPAAPKSSVTAELELGVLALAVRGDSLDPPMSLGPADSLGEVPVPLEPGEGSEGASLLGGGLAMAKGGVAVIRKRGGRARAASDSAVGLPEIDDSRYG
jgi:hypothetical protein